MNRETNIKLVSLRSELVGLHHKWRLMKKSGREHLPRDPLDDSINIVKGMLIEESNLAYSIKLKSEELFIELEREIIDLNKNINK